MIANGAHLHVVGEERPPKTKLAAEDVLLNGAGKGGRNIRVEAFVDHMGSHDADLRVSGKQVAVGDEFVGAPGVGNVGHAQVGVVPGAAVAGEMFEDGKDAVLQVGLDYGGC